MTCHIIYNDILLYKNIYNMYIKYKYIKCNIIILSYL